MITYKRIVRGLRPAAANLAVTKRESMTRRTRGITASPSNIDDNRCAGSMYSGYLIRAPNRMIVAAIKRVKKVKKSLNDLSIRHPTPQPLSQPSIRSLRCASPFPDIVDGKSNDTNKRDPPEKGKDGMPQCQVAQENDPGCSEVEDNSLRESDAALAAIGEDDARQEQGDDEKDREPEDLVDGICKGRVEVDQEDRDEKGGIDHLLDDASSPCRLPFFVLPQSKRMAKDIRWTGVVQAFFSSIPHHNAGDYCSDRQWQG